MRAGFIGLGWWGRELAAAAERTRGRVAIAACWSPDRNQCGQFSSRFPCRIHDSFESMLADPVIEAVVLATPHSLHAGQVIAAAAASKHVLVEKPIALRVSEAAAALRTCRERSVTLAVGHNRRLLAQYGLLASAIERGDCGTLLHVRAEFSTPEAQGFTRDHWRASRRECPGGAMTVLGVHVIDWLHGLFGRVAGVNAAFARRAVAIEMDDTASALITFASGLTATLTCLYAAPYAHSFHVEGQNARIELVATAPETPEKRPTMRRIAVDGAIDEIAVPHVDTLKLQLERWADACAGKGRVAVDGIEAARNVAVLEAMVRSAASGGATVAPDYGELWPS